MKRRYLEIASIMSCMCITLFLGACGGKSGAGTDSDYDAASGTETVSDASESNNGSGETETEAKANVDKPARSLTAEELQKFEKYVNEGDNYGNYGFLMSVYDNPADILLDEVFYTGAGLTIERMTEEEENAYLQAVGGTEIYTDITQLTTAQLDEFLLKKTGLPYKEMKRPLSWTYLEEYDTYYHEHGDTNYMSFTCVGGTTSDDETFTLRFRPGGIYGNGQSDGYHVTDCEAVLEKSEDGYRFVSNRMLHEEGQIADQTFEVEMEPFGKVTFASYEPDFEENPYNDVTFAIIRDGVRVATLPGMSSENILAAAESFDSVAAVSFPDYNGDGYTDVIALVNYSYVQGPDAGTGYMQVRVYEGEEEEYFTLNRKLSNSLTVMEGDKTIAGVLELLKEERKESFVLTNKGKEFLQDMCRYIPDFAGYADIDEEFWWEFIFASYTSRLEEEVEHIYLFREDIGNECEAKVSLEDVQDYVMLTFGLELPDFKPAFEDMEEGQTALYYEDGYYYIGCSDFPDYQYTFKDCIAMDERFDDSALVEYSVSLYEEEVGIVTFHVYPADNENGFKIVAKETKRL